MKRAAVILLWFLFVVVSSTIPSGTLNEHTVEQKFHSGTWPEQHRASIDDDDNDEEIIVSSVRREWKSSLEDGRQKSGASEAGLTRREIGSVQEASSGTDWEGLLLRLAARQEAARRTGNLPPVISLLASNFEKPESVVYESRHDRRRRSLADFPISEYTTAMIDPNDEDEIKKILANAKAQLSTVKSENMEKFRDKDFGNDWLFFVLPFRSGIFTESLFKPRIKGYETRAQNWDQGESWIGDASFSNTGQFVNYNEGVGLDFEKTINKNYESSRSSVDRGLNGELAEISWILGQSQEKYEPNFDSKVIEKDQPDKIEKKHEMDPELRSKEVEESDPDTTDENLESHLQEGENDGSGADAKYETDTGLLLEEAPRDSVGTAGEKYGTNVELFSNETGESDGKDEIDFKLLSNKAGKSYSSATNKKYAADLESDLREVGKDNSEASEEKHAFNTEILLEEAGETEKPYETNPELDLKERGNSSASRTDEKHETKLGKSRLEEIGKDGPNIIEEEYEIDPGSRLKKVIENGTTYDVRSQTKGAEVDGSSTINKTYETNTELKTKEGEKNVSTVGEEYEAGVESHLEKLKENDSYTAHNPKSQTKEAEKNVSAAIRKEYEADFESHLGRIKEDSSNGTYDIKSQTKKAENDGPNTTNEEYETNTELKTKKANKNVSTAIRREYETDVESHLGKIKEDSSNGTYDIKSQTKKAENDGPNTTNEEYETNTELKTNEAEKNVSTAIRKVYDSDATYGPKSQIKETRKDDSVVTGKKYGANVESRSKETEDEEKDSPTTATYDSVSQTREAKKEDSRSAKQNRSDGREYLIKDDEHGSKSEDYRDVSVSVDVKSGEALFGDISIDNTTEAVAGTDKPSTAELPVKIPEVHNKPSENKRPSSDKSLFISNPVVLPAVESQDSARHYGKNYEESTARESSFARPDQSAVDEKLISNGTQERRPYQDLKSTLKDSSLIGNETQSYRDRNLNANDKSDAEKSVPSPPVKNETDENSESNVTSEDSGRNSSGLNIVQLGELLDVRKQLERWRNLYEENRPMLDPRWNSTRVDGSATTDTRREYDKQMIAAETSVLVDAKHRGHIGEESTSNEETRVASVARAKSLNLNGTGERDVLSGGRSDYGVHSDEENVKLERASLDEEQETKDSGENLKTNEFEFDKANNSKYEEENLKNAESNVEKGGYLDKGGSRKKSETENEASSATERKITLENVEKGKDFKTNNSQFDANVENSNSTEYFENEDSKKKSDTEADENIKVDNVIGKDESEENNKKKQHDASDTKETKFKVENSRETELKWQDANDGNKSESNDPGRKLKAESSAIFGDLKSDLESEPRDAKGKKEFQPGENPDSESRKIVGGNEGSDEFKAERLKETEIGQPNDPKEKKYNPPETEKERSESVNPETEKSEQSVERFESQLRDDVLSTSDDSSARNDESIDDSDAHSALVTARKENTTSQQGVEFSEERHNESDEHVRQINGNYSVSEREARTHAKYAINDHFEGRTAKIKNDEIFKEDRWNAKHEESYVTGDGEASFEASAEGNKSRRQEYKTTSREQSLNAHGERDTSENKGKENERVTSRDDASADEASDGKYNLKADRVDTNEKTKEKRKYEEADETKEMRLSSVETEINESSGRNEKRYEEKLSSSEGIAEGEDFEMRGDTTSEDNNRKGVGSSRTRGKNTSSMKGNNALIKGTQLRGDGVPSRITVTAEELAFVSGEIYEKSDGASASSAGTNSTGNGSSNDPGIREGNNGTYLALQLNKLPEDQSNAIKLFNIKSDRPSNGSDFVISSNAINETSRNDENSERILLGDLNGNRATNLSSVERLTNFEDESSTMIGDARVRELQGENKASRSNETDTFKVRTGTNSENDSANRTADKDEIEIRGSLVSFSDLSNTGVGGYSDAGNNNNNSLASQEISIEQNEIDKNKPPRIYMQREHETENKTRAVETEKSEIEATNEVNSLEIPNETADRSIVKPGESERNEYDKSLSKELAKEIGSKTHNFSEDNNVGSARDINTKVNKSAHEGVDSNASGQKFLKSDQKRTDTTKSNEDRTQEKGEFRISGTLANAKDESDPSGIRAKSEHSTGTRMNSNNNTDVQAELLIENHEGIDPVENRSREGETFTNAKNVLDSSPVKIENGSANLNSNIDPSARLFIENQESIHHGESDEIYTGRDNVDPGERNQNYSKTDHESIDSDKSNQKHIEEGTEVGYRETEAHANAKYAHEERPSNASILDSNINISTELSVENQRGTDPSENKRTRAESKARNTLDKISANSYESKDEPRAKVRADDTLKLNLNNELKSIRTKGSETVNREQHEGKTVANDVNLERTSDSFSTPSSEFSVNTATHGERNISLVAINQASEEESEKEGTTGAGNVAEDGSFKHGDFKMIGNLSLASGGSNEMEWAGTVTDEKLESDNLASTLLSIARMLTAKNSEEIRNYYNARDDPRFTYKEINRTEEEDSTNPWLEIGLPRRIDIAQKEAATTEESGSNRLYVDKGEREAPLTESESITRHSNREKALEKGSDASIEVTVNKKEREQSSSNSSSSETGPRGADEITRNDAKECDEHATSFAPGQLIDNNVLEVFPRTGAPPALNTKTTSEAHSSDVGENTIKPRLPGTTAAHPINWTDNERAKQPPIEAASTYKEAASGGETPRSGAARQSKFDPEEESFTANEDSTDKVETVDRGEENAHDAKRSRDDEAERASESIPNEFKDISVENEATGNDEFVNSIVDTSLNESDYRTDVEVDAKRQGKVDPSHKNDPLGVQGNANVENTNDTTLDREHDTNGEHSELDIYRDYHKSKTSTIAHAAEDKNNLLRNGEQGERKAEDPVLKVPPNRENQTQSSSNEASESRIDGDHSGKGNGPLDAGIKIELDKLNKETSEWRPTQESQSYEDKLYVAERTISQTAGDLHGTSKDEKETQIQRALTEAEIAATRFTGLRQRKEQGTYSKTEDKHVSSENYFEDSDKRNDTLKLNVEDTTASDSDPDVSIKSDNTTNVDSSTVTSEYEHSALNDSSSEGLKKITYDSDTEDESRNSLKNNTDLKFNATYGDVQSEFKELTLNKSEGVAYESNGEDEKNDFEVVSINSHNTSDVTEDDLQDQYQEPTLITIDPLNVTYESDAQKESTLNSEKNIDPEMSIESQYTSSTVANDSYDKLKDPALTASNSETVTYESSTRDESKLNSKERIDSDESIKSHTTNAIEIDLRDVPKDVATVASNSTNESHGSEVKDDSRFSSKKDIGTDEVPLKSYYASNDTKDNLNSQLIEPLNITYKSKLEGQSSLDAKTDADISIDSPNTSAIDESNLNNKFKDPAETGSRRESIERHNSKVEKNSENVIENSSEDGETLSVSELGDQRSSSTVFEEHREVNVNEINVSTTESSTNAADTPLDEKEESTKSGKPLFRVSPTISPELDAKFVKKLQPGSDEFAKSRQEIANKSEPVSSGKVQSHSDEKEPARSAKPSSYNSLSKVSGIEAANDDLCTVLRSIFLFTRFRDDARDNEVSSTYDASIDEPVSSNVAKVNSYEPARSIFQKATQDKVDVYVVKQNSEGPVKIAHVENMEPLVVTSNEISRNLYDKIVDMFKRNRIESGSSSKT